VHHDYFAFAAGELPVRKMFSYPPFSSMIRLVVRGPAEKAVAEFAGQLAERVSAALLKDEVQARVLGPAPAPFSKLRGKYRFQLQVQGPQSKKLRQAVATATADF
jgi:primosomal protein N' (replication factor Y)